MDGNSASEGGRQRRQSWHASEPGDSKDRHGHERGAHGHSSSGGGSSSRKQSSSGGGAKGGRTRKSTIEAIKEASCELDPAIAALAIATLSGTASASTAVDSPNVLMLNRRRRSSFSGPEGADDGEGGAAEGSGGTAEHGPGEQDGAGDGEGGAGHGKKKRAGRQRRRSTGSRRQSLDLKVRKGFFWVHNLLLFGGLVLLAVGLCGICRVRTRTSTQAVIFDLKQT